MTRRALLLAGGAAALAGCGTKDEPPAPSATDVLQRQFTAEGGLEAALTALSESDSRALLRRLADRSRRRALLLAVALKERGAEAGDAGPHGGAVEPTEAIRRGRAALEAYVTGLPSQTGTLRTQGAGLVAESAGDVALLGTLYGAPPQDPFPGTPQ